MRLSFLIAVLGAGLSLAVGGGAVAEDTAGTVPIDENAAVRTWLLAETEKGDAVTHAIASADLNRDGVAEAIVYLSGPTVCGSGGCRLYVLERSASGFIVRARTTVTRTPVYVLKAKSHGWQDLAVTVCGGGIVVCRQARLTFDGTRYPSNPTTAPRIRQLGAVPMIFEPSPSLEPLRP